MAVVGVVEESRPWKQWQTHGGREAEAGSEAEEEEDEEEWGADGAAVVVADVVMAAVPVLLM